MHTGVLAAAVILLAACGTTPGAVRDTPSTPALTTDAQNRAAAQAEIRHILGGVRFPGAQRADSAPVPALTSSGDIPPEGGGGVDASSQLTATAYWTIPDAHAGTVAVKLGLETPAGLAKVSAGRMHTPSSSLYTVMYDNRAGDAAAYSDPSLDLGIVQKGPDVAVRADAFVDWRPARAKASLVTGAVREADIRVRPGPPHPPGTLPPPAPATTTRVTDAATIADLVAAANRLVGQADTGSVSCPAESTSSGFYALVLHSTAGTWTFTEPTFCVQVVHVARDGEPVGPTLDGTGFLTALTTVLEARARAGAGPAAAPDTQSSSSSPLTAGEEDNQDAARAEATRLLRSVRLPAGAQRARANPDHFLTRMADSTSNLIAATGFWVVQDADVADVDGFVRAHVPAGMRSDGIGSGTQPGTSEIFTVTDQATGPGTDAYDPPELNVSMVQDGGAVDVRADADVNWRAPRPARSLVSGTVSDVVAHLRDNTRDVTRTVTDTVRIAALTREVDAMTESIYPPGPVGGCVLLTRPDEVESLTFHSDAGTWSFSRPWGCAGSVAVTRDGRSLRAGLDPGGFDDWVSSAVQ